MVTAWPSQRSKVARWQHTSKPGCWSRSYLPAAVAEHAALDVDQTAGRHVEGQKRAAPALAGSEDAVARLLEDPGPRDRSPGAVRAAQELVGVIGRGDGIVRVELSVAPLEMLNVFAGTLPLQKLRAL